MPAGFTHSLPVGAAAFQAPAHVLVKFRSVALAGADRIASAALAGAFRAVCARVERVFAVITKEVGLSLISLCGRSLHASKIAPEGLSCPTSDVSNPTRDVPRTA